MRIQKILSEIVELDKKIDDKYIQAAVILEELEPVKGRLHALHPDLRIQIDKILDIALRVRGSNQQ